MNLPRVILPAKRDAGTLGSLAAVTRVVYIQPITASLCREVRECIASQNFNAKLWGTLKLSVVFFKGFEFLFYYRHTGLMKLHRILFGLLLVFLPTQLGYHVWPEWALVLGRRVDYLSPTLFFTDIVLVAMFLTWIFSSWNKFQISKFKFQINSKIKISKALPFLGIIGFVFINILISSARDVAIYKWVKMVEFGLLGWYIVKTKPSWSGVTFCLSLAVLYSGLIAIGQFFLQHSLGGLLWWLGERTFTVDTPGIARIMLGSSDYLRAYGTFSHPNVLGGFIAATVPLVIVKLLNCYIASKQLSHRATSQFWNASRYQCIYFGVVTIVGITALGLTFSRSAWVVVGIGLAVVGLRRVNYELRIMNNGYLRAIMLFVSFILYSLFFIHINAQEESVVVRQQLNTAAVELWKTSPLLGVGLGNFLVRLPQVMPTRTIYFLQPVHNIYLLVLSETGIIGLVLFIFLIWRILSGHKKLFSMYHLACIILFLLGFVDHYPLTLQQGQLLFTIFVSLSLSL